MAVIQQSKQKVRPVLDYWEFNDQVDAFMARTDMHRKIERMAGCRIECISVRPLQGISSSMCATITAGGVLVV